MSVARLCLTAGCSGLAAPGSSRCAGCNGKRERTRNASPKRQAYRDPLYQMQPRHGVCWICGKAGADTRDHVVPIATQMERYGQVLDHTTRPAHRACNSGRGAKSS